MKSRLQFESADCIVVNAQPLAALSRSWMLAGCLALSSASCAIGAMSTSTASGGKCRQGCVGHLVGWAAGWGGRRSA
jgi:hypothetical protein